MPRLIRVDPHLRREGPTLAIRVEPVLDAQKVMRADGDTIPSASITALIDTGASGTLVQTSVIGKLGIDWISTVLLITPSTTEPLVRFEYRVRIVLSKDIAFETDVVEAPLAGQNVQCLIGRDILELLKLTYDGPNSQFTITLK